MLRYVKLTTGEELIGEFDEYDILKGALFISGPVRIIVSQQITNRGPAISTSMIPYPTARVEINWDKIVLSGEPEMELASAYAEKMGGIVTAPANALQGLK